MKTLQDFRTSSDFFVGLDSDGCVFDSMDIKHKECFAPMFIKHWRLQAAAKYARRAWEFANLYSKSRGMNRFPVCVRTLELLGDWPDATARGIKIPDLAPLRAFIDSEFPPSNAGLLAYRERHPDPLLDLTMQWSLAVNDAVKDIVSGVPPFPRVREALDKVVAQADLGVVSGTPGEALRREWDENGISHYPQIIAGQELGNKVAHLEAMSGAGRYGPHKRLMIGDAPGDRKAAEATGCLFYPINPGGEEESWERLCGEALGRFFEGSYAGEYQADRVAEFEALLPASPPW
ncbi:MAG: HAD hydrolase-like protein [Bryobacterales bacterium]|nr:HAD hydrolase-like protein [Bryobacterales bacterium]